MKAREHFHKAGHRRNGVGFGLLAAACTMLACSSGDAAPAVEAEPTATPLAAPAGPPDGHAWVIFGTDTILAEVASTPEERSEGLMYREEVPDGTGMLFVFQDSQTRSFWMANTYVALSVAYLDPAYRIVDIVDMEPLVTEGYPSRAPAMFALEVRQGWFLEQGIGVGDQAEIVFGVSR